MNRYETHTLIAKSLALDLRPEYRDDLLEMIKGDKISWNRFFQIGSNHLVLQNLYRVYETHQISSQLPEEVYNELKNIFTLNAERNRKILEQAVEINHLLTINNITPVFLKGVAHIMNGLYEDPAERIMGDIDLLVAKDQIIPAVEILVENGYKAPVMMSDDLNHIYKKHHPRLHKPDMPAYIEIHWDAVKPPYNKAFSYPDVFSRKVLSKQYKDCHTMSLDDAAIHNFIHSQLEHEGHNYARVYLRNIYDLLLLSSRCALQDVYDSFDPYQVRAFSYLHLTETVFGVSLLAENKKKKSSSLFIFRYKLNIRFITGSFLFQLLNRLYISTIQKLILFISSKRIRRLTYNNLSSRAWYRQHFKSYRNIFGRRTD